jgi:hypothetical protein
LLRIAWSVGPDRSGDTVVEPGGKLVLARRMTLPEQAPVAVEEIGGSAYVLVRLPYLSDPAVVVQTGREHPVLHRGQRANGVVVEVVTPDGGATTPLPGQRMSLTSPGTRVSLRFPDLTVELVVDFDPPTLVPSGTGTVQLDVDALQHDDAWLVAAIAVALSPDNGVVGHAPLKEAFAAWRGEPERSDGAFDRNVLRPALESRAVELPGPRLNKILYLVERCRRTHEFPPRVLEQVRRRLGVAEDA